MKKKVFNNKRRSFLILFSLFFLMACGREPLYHDLSEADANEILVTLQKHNIEARKEPKIKQNETFWVISVEKEDLSKSQAILVSNNLPRSQELGLGGVYKEKGLIPTPDEQKARFLLALKGEIINSLERLPEVVDADLVLNIPTKNEFDPEGQRKRPTASIIVKAKAPDKGPSPISEFKLQQFVANSVEELAPRDVTVLISYLTPMGDSVRPSNEALFSQPEVPPVVSLEEKVRNASSDGSTLLGLEVSSESKDRFKVYLIIFFLILVLLAAGLIVMIIQTSRYRQEISLMQSEENYPAIEGEVLEKQGELAAEEEEDDEQV